ncbi:extracellular solute-binding protein [Pandoraea sputorum]|uniref:Iron deficiency-induced protein A n=1 Tax=Pandoraea sputorum TaxID=93222 RepID=A0A5E5BAA1_9BURK|nr:extracellular solute-binding protein [Pandoraea sputorum]VVE81992.1 Iron deficiency-induced protein A [Pandoraea sputorum]
MKAKTIGKLARLTVLGTALAAAFGAQADTNGVLNLYSARHYQTDEQLYGTFTKQTGIKINRIEADDAALLERLKSEGAKSPADVILMVDAARLAKADEAGLFQPTKSATLDARIPAKLHAASSKAGTDWYGFSTRARVIVYNKDKVDPKTVQTYASLADPSHKGQVCTRSGSHPYMLSLVGALVAREGAQATQEWAEGMVANFARAPRGGDTDQIKAVATGECGVALANSYYYVRMARSDKPEDKALMSKVGFIWPDQAGKGTHVNVAGAGIAKHAPNHANAVKFLEYLASDEAQQYFANGNNEWPAVPTTKVDNAALAALGEFKAEDVPIGTIAKNLPEAQRILDRAGYK